jgi:hypothetical protein
MINEIGGGTFAVGFGLGNAPKSRHAVLTLSGLGRFAPDVRKSI